MGRGGGLMGVEGKGRVFTRQAAQAETRHHEGFARAVDLELPLLQSLQHETCDP
jgi:hypothetical protein